VRDEPQLRPHQWSRVGAFRYVVEDDHWEWSDEVAHLHGYEPGTVAPTTELVLAHKHPNDRATVADLIEQVRRQGVPFSNRHRLIDTRGVEHVVIVVGDPWYDDNGPAGISGFYVDITEEFNTDVQARLTEAVAAINARQTVINQAIGMLMLRYGLNADAAFQLLSKLSQDSNIKLRTIAEHVVADTETRNAVLEYVDYTLETDAQRVKQPFHISLPNRGQ
jgi:PAS domain S-box-containing protein